MCNLRYSRLFDTFKVCKMFKFGQRYRIRRIHALSTQTGQSGLWSTHICHCQPSPSSPSSLSLLCVSLKTTSIFPTSCKFLIYLSSRPRRQYGSVNELYFRTRTKMWRDYFYKIHSLWFGSLLGHAGVISIFCPYYGWFRFLKACYTSYISLLDYNWNSDKKSRWI